MKCESEETGFVVRSGDDFLWVEQCPVEEIIFGWDKLSCATIFEDFETAKMIMNEWLKEERRYPDDHKNCVIMGARSSTVTEVHEITDEK